MARDQTWLGFTSLRSVKFRPSLAISTTAGPAEVTPRTPARNSPQRPPRSQRTDRDDESTIGVRYGFDSGIPS